ncbi:CehA/McbA family metallohydrolase [Paenibacillus arenilitoris]|uniref:CehA/McbA family metallohydrolase n=1 Tax=Paenibacillus arenilitoris TaxID=2772299 RepID=A0A927CJV7_9BACL|nr:CehA/McbA family metallohydrolase [Paenibacillus arenilitoris]MBD2867025.1 CehA/McbA family metallohydrolase [Paenibacillus arenilitoris]
MAKQTEGRRTSAVYARYIAHSEQSSYIEIPFEMPELVEEVHVRYTVESHGGEDAKAVIDLGVRDGARVRGWSGGARREFRIGPDKATPGYLPGPLEPGEWAVLHNAYKVPEEGCTVTVEVTFSQRAPRWLKGDLHTHSVHSDGAYTLEENAAIMESLGCDFIAMTDHNTSSQNLAYPRQTSVLMIPGTEFTTNFGHANFIGATDPMHDFRVSDMSGVREKFRIARERGARTVLNHPHCDYCPWEWDFAVDHDWVEVWNGPWTERNGRALAWWQEQLASGRRLVAVGGSDVHRPDPYVKHAMPCVWVRAEEKTVREVLSGIDRGHVVITYAPDGPFVRMQCGDYGVGDAVPYGNPGREVLMQFEDLLAGDLVRVYSERGVELEAAAPLDGEWELTADGEERLFLRTEVWRYFEQAGDRRLAAMTNPIYFDSREEEE